MNLNADFTQNVIVRPEENEWVASPMPGVDRMMLDRIGDEVARATSIVRYAPGSSFSSHTHGGGEEFIVLDGVFEDEHGAFPTGAYIRNPPTSSHTPGSAPGCVIFVKLWQFQPEDRTHVRVATDKLGSIADAGRESVEISPLYRDAHEDVRIEQWSSGTAAAIAAKGGAEILLLSGSLVFKGETLSPWTWIRRADGHDIDLFAGPEGARLWVKTGHLLDIRPPSTRS